MREDVTAHIKRIEADLAKPVELLIHCPRCLKQHVDTGEFAKKPHKRHSCQYCGLLFSVTKDLPNIGVQFFEGCKNDELAASEGRGPPIVVSGIYSPGCEVMEISKK